MYLYGGTNMIRYNEVSITTWISNDFRSLSINAKLVWVYFLIGPIRTSLPGIYRVGKGACTDDLDISFNDFEKAFKEIEKKGMAVADWDSKVVMLNNWHKYNRPPSNQNVLRSWLNILDGIPQCTLKDKYTKLLIDIVSNANDAFIPVLEEKIAKFSVTGKQDIPGLDKYHKIAKNYLSKVKVEYPNSPLFKNGKFDNLVENGAKEIDKLVRIDKHSVNDVQAVLDWIVESYDSSQDFNWLDNAQSLSNIRKNAKNGNKKFDNIVISWQKANRKKVKKKRNIDYSGASPI